VLGLGVVLVGAEGFEGMVHVFGPCVAPVDWFEDHDGDEHGDPQTATAACVQPLGLVADSTDCDDTDDQVHADRQERCNGRDDDCERSRRVV
jgi:hypothetical protein